MPTTGDARTDSTDLIPPPVEDTPVAPPAANGGPAPADIGSTVQQPPQSAWLDGGGGHFDHVSPIHATVGGIVLVVAALLLLLPRSLLTSFFVERRAAPGAATRAGWSLYLLLLTLTIGLVAGYIGNLFADPPFLIAFGVVSGLFLLIFLFSFGAARRSMR
jgi:hypothetical protein